VDPAKRLRLFVVVVLVLNVVAAAVAIAVNWPSQFGQVRTDASEDFLAAGTAISAPVLPVALLLVTLLLASRRGAWGWVAIGAAYLTAILLFVGAVGEFVAEGTADTPKSVLVTAGVAWAVIAVILVVLATGAAKDRRRPKRDASQTA
jgi:hypothetical protein